VHSCAWGEFGGPILDGENGLINIAPIDYWDRCPNTRVRVYAVVYEWDIDQQRYTQSYVQNFYLTAAKPTTPLPSPDLDPIASACGYAFLIAGSDTGPPAALPAALANSQDQSYWYEHGLGSTLIQEWRTAPSWHQSQGCQPTVSGGP
jgi:hypothetical protein